MLVVCLLFSLQEQEARPQLQEVGCRFVPERRDLTASFHFTTSSANEQFQMQNFHMWWSIFTAQSGCFHFSKGSERFCWLKSKNNG